ncbi:hypothetical protein PSPO_a0270 [Pseudoalteromonas spongiae UST010723-006]|nr:hypothetical protein PSPO_a0270 [Pseudoalteromonas spongiae UST010723-006]
MIDGEAKDSYFYIAANAAIYSSVFTVIADINIKQKAS